IEGTKDVIEDIDRIYENIENLELFNIDTTELKDFLFKKVTNGISDRTNGNINYKGNEGARKNIEDIVQRLAEEIK
ncbi:TPA: hypothetical protein ACQOCN_001864, partial [Streptococcus pyogenes]